MTEIDINSYKVKIETVKETYDNLATEKEIKELFKGIFIMFLKEVLQLFNKVLKKVPDLKFSKSSEKISNLNIILECLESDGILFNVDVNEVIVRGYTTYIYMEYRDYIMDWNIESIKLLNEESIKSVVIDTAKKEEIEDTVADYLNIIPELVLIINNLKEKDILKLLYLLNNLNVIVDVYLLKKSQNIF
jgi:hypothetical protein